MLKPGTRIRLLAVITPVWFIGIAALAAYLRPGYSHISQHISELGEAGAPHAWIINYGGYVPAGILIILFSLAIRPALDRGALSTLVLASFMTVGAGTIFSGFFHCDNQCIQRSLSGEAHDIATYAIFAASSLTPLFSVPLVRRRFSNSLLNLSLASGLILAALFLLYLSSLSNGYEGLVQRAAVAVYFMWFVFFGFSASRKTDEKPIKIV